MQPLASVTISSSSHRSLAPKITFTQKELATSTHSVWFRIATTFIDSRTSEAGVADFLGSVKNLAISIKDSSCCNMSLFTMFLEKVGVFSLTVFIFLFLACFSSSTVSSGFKTVVVSRDSKRSYDSRGQRHCHLDLSLELAHQWWGPGIALLTIKSMSNSSSNWTVLYLNSRSLRVSMLMSAKQNRVMTVQ